MAHLKSTLWFTLWLGLWSASAFADCSDSLPCASGAPPAVIEASQVHDLSDINKAIVNGKDFSHVDPKELIPRKVLIRALEHFEARPDIYKNRDYLVIVDFRKHMSKKRFFLVSLKSGHVYPYMTSHGQNSNVNGYAKRFSNKRNSLKSSLGFYVTGQRYAGDNGLSLRLYGLNKSNDNAFARRVAIHPSPKIVEATGKNTDLSDGCLGLDKKYAGDIISKIADGALVYVWAGQ
jgi:hypothetical protein